MVDNYNFNIQINNDKHIHFIEGIPGSGKSTVLISLPDTSYIIVILNMNYQL